jgi:hypothetical protein
MNFIPIFGFDSLHGLSLFLILFIKSSLIRIKSFKSYELMSNFIIYGSHFFYFFVSLYLRMKQGFDGQNSFQE